MFITDSVTTDLMLVLDAHSHRDHHQAQVVCNSGNVQYVRDVLETHQFTGSVLWTSPSPEGKWMVA